MKKTLTASFALIAALFLSDASSVRAEGFEFDARRGSPAEYDPGPAKGSAFAKLMGSTPNYRALGQLILGDGEEKFRWHMGPMWYRGRLGRNEVKVFVVGQEGAQDENVSNRAFTGSTGTKTQKFLNHLGIYSSYLFLNTFVYTINGQLDPENPAFKWMEQGEDSPIVEYRHSLFDQMAKQNKDSVALMIGVGTGGKASLATWINARGGDCSPAGNMNECDTRGLKRTLGIQGDLVVVGVPHPGGASPSNGGLAALENIIRGFTAAARKVAAFKRAHTDWLPQDAEIATGRPIANAALLRRLDSDYRYGDAPVPFRDFAFGTNWRMGAQGTTSNRRGSDAIQLFSAAGKYNNDGHTVRYARPGDVLFNVTTSRRELAIPGMEPGDLPYEAPRFALDAGEDAEHVSMYDHGPCGGSEGEAPKYTCRLSQKLQNWAGALSSLETLPVSHPTLGTGPVYRGRLYKPEVLVLADQMDHDDLFSTRALTGEAGQKLQALLEMSGAKGKYAILRTLPVDTLGMEEDDVRAMAMDRQVQAVREAIIAEITKGGLPTIVVTMGELAEEVYNASGELDSQEFDAHLPSPGTPGWAAKWDEAAGKIADALGTEKDGRFTERSMSVIPREDLPSHTRWWMGTTGSRVARGEGNDDVFGNYYQVHAPRWVSALRPRELDRETRDEVSTRLRAALAAAEEIEGRGGEETETPDPASLPELFAADAAATETGAAEQVQIAELTGSTTGVTADEIARIRAELGDAPVPTVGGEGTTIIDQLPDQGAEPVQGPPSPEPAPAPAEGN